MRWQSLTIADPAGPAPLPMGLPDVVVRRFDTPGFAGMTFYEVRAKSLINKVPAASRMPFDWTINPYRGCSHACTYCYARNTHSYLDFDAGHDFDSKVVVKVNAGELLRRELGAPRWRGEPIAMGTNVDCYQRAEGRYGLMREIIAALRDFANPFSILTKGTLITRDLDLLRQAAAQTTVEVSFSIGFVDPVLWRSVEPGTPSPRRRLDAVRRFTDAGFAVTVMLAPVLPGLSDTEESIDATVGAVAAAGATGVIAVPLHLRPGAREWYLAWLDRVHPELGDRYRELFSRGSYSPSAYRDEITARVRLAARRHGLVRARPDQHRRADPGTGRTDPRPVVGGGPAGAGPAAPATFEQLALL
jgi:DNA repair photolyase